jgi:hypothetical protein
MHPLLRMIIKSGIWIGAWTEETEPRTKKCAPVGCEPTVFLRLRHHVRLDGIKQSSNIGRDGSSPSWLDVFFI